jgi:hypothetical protein
VFRVRAMGGESSFRAQWMLSRVVAAALGTGRGVNLAALKDGAPRVFLDLAGALSALPYDELKWLRDEFATLTTVTYAEPRADGAGQHAPKTVQLGDHFESHMGGARQRAIIPWLAFCLEVNFGDGFFSEVLAGLGLEKVVSGSSSPKGATGSSGASTSASD